MKNTINKKSDKNIYLSDEIIVFISVSDTLTNRSYCPHPVPAIPS